MKRMMLRALPALMLAATLTAGCGDVPTAATERSGAEAAKPRLSTGVPLSVSVSCAYWYGSDYDCTATASGGSGTGYSFTWAYGGEYYDQGGVSKAYVRCNKYSGSYHGTLSNYGNVTDSNGDTAWFSVSRSC